MSLLEAMQRREEGIISRMKEIQAGISDPNGKGLGTEAIVEKELIRPFLPPRFDCVKGAVVDAAAPEIQSAAIDRVIFDRSASPPLVHDPNHSILAIESVCGLVEITVHLDAKKLENDIRRMAPIKEMLLRRAVLPVPNTATKVVLVEYPGVSPRSFVIGLPADPNWSATSIAEKLRDIQRELGSLTHVHGLYVIGTGFFETGTVEPGEKQTYKIYGSTGPDRLFQFSQAFRQAFDRWGALPPIWSMDLSQYVKGGKELLAE